MTTSLILVRHAETGWSAARRLTGWSDPPLSDHGVRHARQAGAGLAASGVVVERVYTSLLRRATQTATLMGAAAGARPVPAVADWRLNERHLGQLEGLTKAEIRATWGNGRRTRWRDDEDSRPPPLDPGDPRHPRHDPRYEHVPAHLLPGSERGRETALRVIAVFHDRVVPDVLAGRTVLLVAHLGPLRVLARHLGCDGPDGAPIADWPHGEPLPCRVATPCCARMAGAPGE